MLLCYLKQTFIRCCSKVNRSSDYIISLNFIISKMGIIKLNSIKVYAYHGCLVEEGQIGSDYIVDLEVTANLKEASFSDKLHDTVDYVHLNNIVKEEMAIRSKLLEHVCKRILDRAFAEIDLLDTAMVSVSKINPPIGGDVASVSVVLTKKR